MMMLLLRHLDETLARGYGSRKENQMTENAFEVFVKSGPGVVTILRGAKLDLAMERAKQVAQSRQAPAYVKNSLSGAVHEVAPR